MREADLDYFRNFVAATRWRFAKTYGESYPHEHMLQQWVDADTLSRAIQSIEQWGFVDPSGRLSEDTFTSTSANIAHGQCDV